MRIMLALTMVLSAAAAFAPQGVVGPASAQSAPPAAVEKPAAQAKPKTAPEAPKYRSVAEKAQGCLDIDDGTKGRLDCYDAAVPPKPTPKPVAAKGILDCRHLKEEDERLACFNGFAEQIPKFTH
jgi:hypothetical protein